MLNKYIKDIVHIPFINLESLLSVTLNLIREAKWHYTPNIDLAFVSVEHIMRDVHYG